MNVMQAEGLYQKNIKLNANQNTIILTVVRLNTFSFLKVQHNKQKEYFKVKNILFMNTYLNSFRQKFYPSYDYSKKNGDNIQPTDPPRVAIILCKS